MFKMLSACGIDVGLPLFWTLLFVVALVPSLMRLHSFLRLYLTARDLPGPSGHLLIGNMLDLVEPQSVFHTLNKNCSTFGKLFKFWFPNNLIVVMVDPAEVKFVINSLKENNRPDHISKVLTIFCGNGMLSVPDGEVYKTHKRVLFPMFYPAMLKNFHLVFEEKSRGLCQRLSKIADGETIDIFEYVSSYTMETICSTVVGCDVTDMKGVAKPFVEAIKEADYLIPVVIAQPWLRIPWIQGLFSSGRRVMSAHKCINTFIERIVTEKLQAAVQTRQVEPEVPVGKTGMWDGDRRREVLSMLDMIVGATESGSDKFSAGDIRDELLSFINAGFMTTGTTLAFLVVLLGIHEEVQEEVSRELEEVFGSSLRAATTEDLSRLVVLDRVIKETLRLFPAVPLVPREISEEVHLQSGKVLPAGTNILVYVYQLQRDPESYQDPESFVPDRWRPENSSLLNPDAFIPFGTGTRTCIGFRYAMLQMKVTASNLLRRFKVTTSYKMEDLTNLGVSISLILYGGYKVELHKREIVK